MKIVAVQREGNYITAIKLEDGTELSTQDAIAQVFDGKLVLEDVKIVESKTGLSYLRSVGDGDDANNLKNLPSFGSMNSEFINPHNANPGDSKTIVAVQRHGRGRDITAYKLNDGTILNEQQAVEAVNNGEITGYTIGNRDGESYIRSYPDSCSSNNLSNLPEF